jgi:hypothetical protein
MDQSVVEGGCACRQWAKGEAEARKAILTVIDEVDRIAFPSADTSDTAAFRSKQS